LCAAPEVPPMAARAATQNPPPGGAASQISHGFFARAAWAIGRGQTVTVNLAVCVASAAGQAPKAVSSGLGCVHQQVAASYGDLRKQGLQVWTADALCSLGGYTGTKTLQLGSMAVHAATTSRALLQEGARSATKQARRAARDVYVAASQLVSKRSFQATFVSATGGAVACATGGGVAGLTTGGALGAAAGLPFALFTFGLSVPIGAMVGGGAGLVVGATAGATAGAVGGGAVGYGAYSKRAQVSEVVGQFAAKLGDGAQSLVAGATHKPMHYLNSVSSGTRLRLSRAGTGSTEDLDSPRT